MKALKVYPLPEELQSQQNQLFVPTAYPHPGLFLCPVTGSIYVVTTYVTMVSGATADFYTEIDEAPTGTAIMNQHNGVSENTLLKAIALARKPELAEKLCL